MRVGLPILANTAVFGAVLNLDRVLILWRVPDGDRAAGLYTIAIMGTSWSLDLAGPDRAGAVHDVPDDPGPDPRPGRGRAAGRCGRPRPRRRSWRPGARWRTWSGPVFLGALMPRYVEGLPALRPLLPGMVLLGLAWPARQMLIAIDRPYRLCLATSLGLALTAAAGRRRRPRGDRRRGLGDDDRVRGRLRD